MTQVTSAEIQKHFGTYKREALNAPIEITVHGKSTLVLMSYDRYQSLLEGGSEDAPAVTEVPVDVMPDFEGELEELERIAGGSGDVLFADDPIDD